MKFKKFTLYDLSSKDVTSLHVCEINLFQEPATGSDFWRYLYFLKKFKCSVLLLNSKIRRRGGERMLYRNLLPQKFFRVRAGPGRDVFFGAGPGREKIFRAGPGRAATKISGPGRATFENILRAGPGRATLNCHGPGRANIIKRQPGPARAARPRPLLKTRQCEKKFL